MFFYCVLVFVLTRQELSSTLLKSNFRNIIIELHSSGIVVWCLRPFHVWGLRSDDETVVGKRRLCLFESSGTLITPCLSFRRLEEMKLWSLILCAQAWDTQSDDVPDPSISRPVSYFWGSAILKFFTLKNLDKVLHWNTLILRIWSWADNHKVHNYFLHFSRFRPLTDFAFAAIK